MLFKYCFKHCKLNVLNCRIMSVFTQKLNPILGESGWESQDEHYDFHQEIARSSFADMLHDTERNQKYYEAIKLAINKMHSLGRPAKVLDIGTGTGLLSMMAVKCGADSVIACESFSPIADCAKKVVALNGFGDRIRIINKQSVDLTVGEGGDLVEKANILVSEVFDTELIGEGAIITFNHARLKLLEDDCIVVPSSALVYAQVVETQWAQNWNGFKDLYSNDGELLVQAPLDIKNCPGSSAVHDIQLSQLPPSSFKTLVAPHLVARFDWDQTSSYTYLGDTHVIPVKAISDGIAQVVFMWWELIMDTKGEVILSCAPYWAHPLRKSNTNLTNLSIPWRDHWMQALYYLPKCKSVRRDQDLSLVACRDQFSWWFYLESHAETQNNFAMPHCECGLHTSHSRTKIGMMNDNIRNKKYLSVLEKFVNADSVVLFVSDGFYLGLAAAKLGAKKVFYLKDNYFSTSLLEKCIKANNITNCEILQNCDSLKPKNVNFVMGQPHFFTSILPWDGLFFSYMLQKLRGSLSDNCVIAPKSVSIKGLIVQFHDLQKIRLPLGLVEEFNMKPFDELILSSSSKCDDKVEAQPLWEYPCIAQSAVKEFVNLNLETLTDAKTYDSSVKFQVEGDSNYNGVALWTDWDLDGTSKNVITTGPIISPEVGQWIQWDMHTRQGVHFLKQDKKKTITSQFHFNAQEGKINFSFS
ncbi:protein arginine N-methyltransferase 7-like isoform X1 [Photinus pyralis]|nr:protein arginine N-methyltransferase 7 isoform X1 [Photinus pyralis]XP_031348771.1 protein arginine N-methyltransferase 7-like isoform X1 [Photinus pyralis]